MAAESWASEIKLRAPLEKTEPSKPLDMLARDALFKHVDNELLIRISFNGQIPRDDRDRTQEHMLDLVAVHLKNLADSTNNNKSAYIRTLSTHIRKIKKALVFLAGDSSFERNSLDEQKREVEESRVSLELHLISLGKSADEIKAILAEADEDKKQADRQEYITQGYDKILNSASFFLGEAADILMAEWEEKKQRLVPKTPEELSEFLSDDPDLAAYARKVSFARQHSFKSGKEILDNYIDSLKAKAEILHVIRDDITASLAPALAGPQKA